jgi:membrane-associated PAP2 superfamily phosphatase
MAVLVLQYTGLDSWLAGHIYAYLGGWTLTENWFLQTVIHHGGRNLISLIVTLMLLAYIITWLFFRSHKVLCGIFLYLSLATTLSLLLVSGLKQITTLPCPWSMLAFGGTVVDTHIDQAFSSAIPLAHCFPAGHSSGGFALFSLYFAARIARDSGAIRLPESSMQYYLLPGLVLGVIFGLAQELRGAHFLSHDITTAALCWLVSGLLWIWFFAPPKEIVKHNRGPKLAMRVWNKIALYSPES